MATFDGKLLCNGPFTSHESENESGKDQRTMKKDQRISDKHVANFLFLSLLLGVNEPLE